MISTFARTNKNDKLVMKVTFALQICFMNKRKMAAVDLKVYLMINFYNKLLINN